MAERIRGVQLRSPRSASGRAVRAGVFALAGTALGVAAHRLGGGTAPPPWLVLGAGFGLFVLAVAFTGGQRRLPALLGLVLTTQTAMHVGFTVVGMRTMAPSGATGGERSLLSMVLCHTSSHAPSTSEVVAARATLTSLHASAPPPSHGTAMPTATMLTPSMAWMLAAHLLAATAMAWWLARGERVVWRCARRAVQTIRAVAQGVPVPRPASSRGPVPRPVPSLRTRWRTLCAPGRAPPAVRPRSFLPAAS